MTNLTIFHITPYYIPAWNYGGPIQSISKLVESQSGFKQCNINVLTTTADGEKELFSTFSFQLINHAQVNYFPRRLLKNTFFSPMLIKTLYKKANSKNIVHIHTWWNFTAILSVAICYFKGIRPILSPRGMLSPYSFQSGKSIGKKIFQTILGKWLLRKTILHATSELELKECLEIYPGWPHFVLPNLLELPILNSVIRPVTNSDTLGLLFISRIHPKKGLDFLFDVLSKVEIPWKLSIAGDGDEQYICALKNRAERMGIEKSVHWLGWVDRTKAFHLMANADALVLPSQNENFANVVLESLSVGTPVLISDQVGLCEYVHSNNLGWVSPLKKEQWISAIIDLARSSSQRQWIYKNAPMIIQRDFLHQTLALKYLQAYQQALTPQA